MAAAWVERYRLAWETWDAAAFADLFSEDAVYFEHPVDETVIGRGELERYLRKEQDEEGEASVRMGAPMVDGDQLFGEFWVAMTNAGEEATLSGCFVARLDPDSGRCTHYRQYWFEIEGHREPFDGWGRGGPTAWIDSAAEGA